MSTYAYIRVSSKDQNIDRQIQALRSHNVQEDDIFIDWQSGKNFQRSAYRKMIKRMRSGDLVIVKSIDRLGRNYNDILIQWQLITKENGADIIVLDMELLDTRRKYHDLTGKLIADLVLQILAYVAQTEREYIRQRQAEGIAAARAKGRKLGRHKKPLPERFEEVCQDCRLGNYSVREAAFQLGMSQATFFRRYRDWTDKGEVAE